MSTGVSVEFQPMSADEQSFPSPPEDDLLDIFIHWFLFLAAIIQVYFIFSAVFYSKPNVPSSQPRVDRNLKKSKKHL
ncbi:unnamed protein product [Schistosoma turkestanicum]|nr:unnamed protein product [Schistosoma turkestanicum]